jgi:hypothetical protein
MTKITNSIELREAIRDLEHQDYVNEQVIRERISNIRESIRPLNILKNTVGYLFTGPGIKTNLLRMGVGLITSFLVKKVFKKVGR